jgi:hypothetical protein
MKHRDRP